MYAGRMLTEWEAEGADKGPYDRHWEVFSKPVYGGLIL